MIRAALLGTGAIADSHLQAYQTLGDRCRVVAVADQDPAKAADKAARYGLKADVYRSVGELLAGVEFDAVSVCLPPFGHAEATVALLQAGKHVLVEKPMATSLAECDAMIAAAQAGGCLLSVVAQNRFRTPMMRLKRVLESGLIGRVLHAQVDSFWWRGSNYYDLWWRGTWAKEGGGCTMNHAVHHLDLFLWMMGSPAELQAVSLNLNHTNSEVEDFATAVLAYPEGAAGQITASLVHHGEEQRLVFQGEKAKVAVPWQVQASTQRENGFPEDNPALVAEIEALYASARELTQEGHPAQVANFVAAIEGREPLLVDGAAGRRTVELVTAIYQSSHLGGRVQLPLTPEAPFYTGEGILRHARRFHEKTRSVEGFSDNSITLGRDYGR